MGRGAAAMDTSAMPPSFTWSMTLREHAGFGLPIRDHHHGVVGTLDVQSLDGGAHLA